MSTLTSPSNKYADQVLQTPIDTITGSTHLKIMAGLISGLIAAVILICFILYAVKKFKSPTNRNRSLNEHVNEDYLERITFETNNKNEGNNNDSSSLSMKHGHRILLVYTYDCEQHFNVIKAFANFLREICKLTVYFDFWEEEEIKTIGVESWLDKNLEISDYVLVIWSIGARIKCSSKLNHALAAASLNSQSFLDDNNENINFSKIINDLLFNYSINYILKTTRQQQIDCNNDETILGNDKYLNIYFDYSNKNDVSYKFDAFKQYKLMFDFKKFLQHIFLNQSFLIISNYLGIYMTANENIGDYSCSSDIVRLKLENQKSSNSRKDKKLKNKYRSDSQATTTQLLLDHQSVTSSMTSTQFNENLINLKKIYIEQLYKQITNTQNYFKQNPNWFEDSLFQHQQQKHQSSVNVNVNNSTLTLDSSIGITKPQQQQQQQLLNNTNSKLISFSSSSSSIANIAEDTITVPTVSSSNSLISLNSNTNTNTNNNNNTNNTNSYKNYNDYFMHPLPTSIDSNYFNLIEERLKNYNLKNHNNNNDYFIDNNNAIYKNKIII